MAETTSWRDDFRISIIGAGPVGLATAIFLCRAGYPVTVFEREPELRAIGAGIQLPITHNKVLKDLGLLEEVGKHAWWTRAIVLHKYNSGKELFKMPLNPEIEQKYGAPHFIVHRADIRGSLAKMAESLGVEIKFGSKIDFKSSALADSVITFSDGSTLQSNLVLGADGEHSKCREALVGHEDAPEQNGRVANRVCIDWKLIDADPELSALFGRDEPCIRTWLGPECQAVAYPLKEQLNFIFNRPLESEPFIGPRPVDMPAIREFVKDWDPVIQKLMNISEGQMMWMTFETNVHGSFVHPGGKFALLGDAAHSMVSYLAHGAAMGIEDSSVLGNLMSKATSPAQVPEILKVYDELRQPRTTLVKQASVKMGEYWHMANGPLCDERDRQLLNETPSAGFPMMLCDPFFQHWIWSYDPKEDAEKAWAKHC